MSIIDSEISPDLQKTLYYGIRRGGNWRMRLEEPKESDQVAKLRMPTFETDLMVLGTVFTLLEENAAEPDVFFRHRLDEVQHYLLQSPLFTALNSPLIKVSPAHRGTTPFKHTLNVLQQVDTTYAPSTSAITLARKGAIIHDVGKVVLAYKDFHLDHCVIGALITFQLCQALGLPDLEVKQLQQIVQLHHVFEYLHHFPNKAHLFAGVFADQDTKSALTTVATADVLSVPAYKKYVQSIHKWLPKLEPKPHSQPLPRGL